MKESLYSKALNNGTRNTQITRINAENIYASVRILCVLRVPILNGFLRKCDFGVPPQAKLSNWYWRIFL
jgi:hypothetical protein